MRVGGLLDNTSPPFLEYVYFIQLIKMKVNKQFQKYGIYYPTQRDNSTLASVELLV